MVAAGACWPTNCTDTGHAHRPAARGADGKPALLPAAGAEPAKRLFVVRVYDYDRACETPVEHATKSEENP